MISTVFKKKLMINNWQHKIARQDHPAKKYLLKTWTLNVETIGKLIAICDCFNRLALAIDKIAPARAI